MCNMSRLIDADKIDFNEIFKGQSDFAKDTREAAQSLIDAQPTVEAVPVVHGEWLDFYGDYSTAECDRCAECYEVSPDSEPKKEYFEAFKQCYNFCPNCGADMRKEK